MITSYAESMFPANTKIYYTWAFLHSSKMVLSENRVPPKSIV